MNVRHLRTADPLIDPSHHVTQDALRVVLDLLRDLRLAQILAAYQGDGQQIRQGSARPAGPDFVLPRKDIDRVIMRRVQRRGGWRRHPGTVRAGLRMADLGAQHLGHAVGHRPHPLADLRPPLQPAGQPDIDVAILIGQDPGRGLHLALGQHRAGLHRGMDFVARTVQEPGVDECHPMLGRTDALLEVGRGAAFLVHDAQFHGIARKTQDIFNHVKDFYGKLHLVRPMHLGFDDINGPMGRIAPGLEVVHRDGHRDQRIHQPLADLAPVRVQHRGVGHQMPDIADQHQRAALDGDLTTHRRLVGHIGVHLPRDRLAALLEGLDQIALHQPQPIGIGRDLVPGVDAGDRILAVHDRRQCRFQPDVRDSGLVRSPDLRGGIDQNFDLQPVVFQHNLQRAQGVFKIADKLRRILQPGPVGQQHAILDLQRADIRPGPARQGHRLVEEAAPPGDHPRAALGVIALALGQVPQRIGAVQRIVQRPPPRISGVQRKARIGDRHHQLRPRHRGNLGIYPLGLDGKIRPLGQQIADLLQKRPIGCRIMRLTAPRPVPVVDLPLNPLAGLQQGAVLGPELCHHLRQTRPEGVRLHTCARKNLLLHEINQFSGDLKTVPVVPSAHSRSCHPRNPVPK